MQKKSLFAIFITCLVAVSMSGCKTDEPEYTYTGKKIPIVRRYALELDVKIAFIKPLRDDEDEAYRYEAELEILQVLRGKVKFKAGDKLTVDIDVPAMTYYKLKPGETFRVRLKAPLIQAKRYRLVPGSVVTSRK
jgi:hypothetical protein